MLPLRGDGIKPEDDLGEDGDYGDHGDHGLGEEEAASDCDGDCGDTADGELKDGALRLTGGHDDTEVSCKLVSSTCHVSRVTCHVSWCRVTWRCGTRGPGAACVTTSGTRATRGWRADR